MIVGVHGIDRPVYKGKVVPFVARYELERPDRTVPIQMTVGVPAEGGKPRLVILDTPQLHRDDLGWLWTLSPINRNGRPEFAAVHPARHRVCMDKGRCQVCGGKIEGPLLFMDWTGLVEGEQFRTAHPPLCEACVPLALDQCPFLRRSEALRLVEVPPGALRRIGCSCDVYGPDGQVERRASLANDHPDASRSLARQRVVGADEWRFVPCP